MQEAMDILKDHFNKTVGEMSSLIKNVQISTMNQIQDVGARLSDLKMEFKDYPSIQEKMMIRLKNLETAGMSKTLRIDKLYDKLTKLE